MSLKAEVLAELEDLNEGDGGDIVADLVNLFEANSTALTQTMRDSVASKNFKEFERAAHTLKGSAAGLGLEDAAQFFFDLEQRGKNAQIDDCGDALQQGEKRLKECVVLLRDYLGKRILKSA